MKTVKIIDSPMDTEPDLEYDVERPASRYRRKFKRRYLGKSRKNAGNNDYISILRLAPDDRGCAIVYSMLLIIVGLVLILTLQPMMIMDANSNITMAASEMNNGNFSALKHASDTVDKRKKAKNRPTIQKTHGHHIDEEFTTFTEAPTPFKQTYTNGTHGGEGPDEGDTVTTLQRRCSTGYQTPHERSQATLKNYATALLAGFGNCGPNGEKHTSLSQTVKRFGDIHPTYGNSGDGWMWLEPAKKAVGVRHISLPFHAIGIDGTPRTKGGDEFVLTFLGWTNPTKFLSYEMVLIKTAVIAQDRGNGKYDAFLAIPDIPFQKVSLTLSHYYGCYQGFFHDKYRHSSDYLKLDTGPLEVDAHFEFNKLVFAVDRDEDYGWWNEDLPEKVVGVDRRWLTVPECEGSQMGVDGLTNGIWADRVRKGGEVAMSTDSVWLPLCCRNPSSHSSSNLEQIRIGDSTMPNPTLKVGNVYDILQPFHKQWVDYLVKLYHEHHVKKEVDTGHGGVLVLSTGLQYLSRYKPETSAKLVTRMLCQITLFYPGKVLLTGAVPIQHQIDSKFDVTDQNVRLLDAILRQRVEKAGGHLDDICEDSDVERLYGFERIHGFGNRNIESSRNKDHVTNNHQKFNKEREDSDIFLAHTNNFMKLNWVMKKMSKTMRQLMWGNRKVVYVDVDSFSRQLPEISKENDKIQVVEPGREGRSTLFEGAHEKLFMNMIHMRQADKDH